MKEWFQSFSDEFVLNFIKDNRWEWLVQGLKNTLIITFFATIIGIVIGVVIATVRSTYDTNYQTLSKKKGLGFYLLSFFNAVCKIYLTVIRGTPIVVQLLIMYFIILVSFNNETTIAVIAFGVNSGAYVAEIFRSGIMSIDKGQFEAGRSLGFNYVQTMTNIVIPQVFKNVLPTLCNEFIALLKETSVVGYIAVQDLTKGIYIIIGRTYSYYLPLIVLALIYLLMVMILSWLVGKLERRLRNSDH